MKTKFIKVLILFATLWTSCQRENMDDEEEHAANISNTTKRFMCNINGTLFETDSTDYSVLNIDSIAQFKVLVCQGFIDSTFISIGFTQPGISLNLPFTPQTFPLSYLGVSKVVNGVYYDTYQPISANLQFTNNDSINNLVSGVFSGTVVENTIHDTVIITYGKFTNVKYHIY